MQDPVRSAATRRLALRQMLAACGAIAAPWVWRGVDAAPAGELTPTPAQTEGPFYPDELPADTDADLLRNGVHPYTSGVPAWVEGRITDAQGRPLRGAVVEIWQCDHAGHYLQQAPRRGASDAGFQGYGRVAVDDQGGYRFRTLRPVSYPGRTPHIHFKVRLDRRELLTTQLYVEDDPGNARDGLWRRLGAAERAALTVPFRPADEGLRARFPIVVATG